MAAGTLYIVAKTGSFLYSPRKTQTDYEDRNMVWRGQWGELGEASLDHRQGDAEAGQLEDQAACPAEPKIIQDPGELPGAGDHSCPWVVLPEHHL